MYSTIKIDASEKLVKLDEEPDWIMDYVELRIEVSCSEKGCQHAHAAHTQAHKTILKDSMAIMTLLATTFQRANHWHKGLLEFKCEEHR